MTETLFESKYAEDIIVEKTVSILADGGIIVIPTDTIPGIGCRADNKETVRKLFELKDRPENLALPVIISSTDDVRNYAVDIPKQFAPLADKFWPGALTIVLKSNGKISRLVGGGLETLGFRVPDYSLVRSVVKKAGFPIALTSANPHTVPPSASHERLLKWWKGKVEMIIIGTSIESRPPSTVVDLSGEIPSILRVGVINQDEICSILSCD